jgi:hypothetical protein
MLGRTMFIGGVMMKLYTFIFEIRLKSLHSIQFQKMMYIIENIDNWMIYTVELVQLCSSVSSMDAKR